MSLIDDAVAVVRATEGRLKELIAHAASSGDYHSIVRIAPMAQAIRSLVEVEDSRPSLIRPALPLQSERAPGRSRLRKVAVQPSYPRFEVRRGALVRIAWSKSERHEYEQKVPTKTVERIVKALVSAGLGGRVFSIEDVLPVLDGEDQEIPMYQLYVVVGALRQVGLMDQHGRRGYSLLDSATLAQSVEKLLADLTVTAAETEE